MATYQVQGGLSGQVYTFETKTDDLTPEQVAEIQGIVQQREDAFQTRYFDRFGEQLEYDAPGAIGRGFDVAGTDLYEEIGGALRDLGQSGGLGFLERMGSNMEQSARREQLEEAGRLPSPTRLGDVEDVGDFLTFAGEGLGQSLPYMAATAAGGLLGAKLAPAAVVGATAVRLGLPYIAGGAAASTPLFYANNVGRREDVGGVGSLDAEDRLRALGTAGVQALLNSVADKILLTGKALGLSVPPAQRLFTRVAQQGAAGAATEAPTEIAQQLLERWQAGLPVDDDEAIKEYIEAGVLGGTIGGGVRGTLGAFSSSREEDGAPEGGSGTDTEADTAPAAGTGGVSESAEVQNARDFFERRLATIGTDDATPRDAVEAEAARSTLAMLESEGKLDLPELRIFVRSMRAKLPAEPDMGPPSPPLDAYRNDTSAVSEPADVQDARDAFEERAAILVDDGMPTRDAEAEAARRTLAALESEGKLDLPEFRDLVRSMVGRAPDWSRTELPVDVELPPLDAYVEGADADPRQRELDLAPVPAEPEAASIADQLIRLGVGRTAKVARLARENADLDAVLAELDAYLSRTRKKEPARADQLDAFAQRLRAEQATQQRDSLADRGESGDGDGVAVPDAEGRGASVPDDSEIMGDGDRTGDEGRGAGEPAAPDGGRVGSSVPDAAGVDGRAGAEPDAIAAARSLNLSDIDYGTVTFDPVNSKAVRSQGRSPIISFSDRNIVVRDVNGVRVPFYLSTGMGGKEKAGVPAGKWYPFFGLDVDSQWFNKGTSDQIASYYGSDALRAAAQELDAVLGDVRANTDIPKAGFSGPHIDAINQGLNPAGPKDQASADNIADILRRIEGLQQPASRPDRTPAEPESPEAEAARDARALEVLDRVERAGRTAEGPVIDAIYQHVARTEGMSKKKRRAADKEFAELLGQGYDIEQGLLVPPATARPAPTVQRSAGERQLVVEQADAETRARPVQEWFDENASDAIKKEVAEQTREARPDQIGRSRDYNLVRAQLLGLTDAKLKGLSKEEKAQRRAASVYFSRMPRVDMVLEEIAADVADGSKVARNAGEWYTGKGGPTAEKAAEWVRATLTPTAIEYMDAQQRAYQVATSESALQSTSDATDAKIKNRLAEMNERTLQGREAQVQRETEITRAMLSEEEAAEAGFGTEDLSGYGDLLPLRTMPEEVSLGRPLHPVARRYLRGGNIRGALRDVAARFDRRLGRVARVLVDRLLATPVSVVPEAELDALADAMGYTQRGDMRFKGMYIPQLSDAALERVVAPEMRDRVRALRGTILLNDTAGMDTRTLLHEAVHALSARTLFNRSHPMTRQIETLRTTLQKVLGPRPELEDNHEFLAEAMSNPMFQTELANLNMNGTKITALQRVRRAAVNMLRSVLGMPTRSVSLAMNEVDRLFEQLTRAPVDYKHRDAGDLTQLAFLPLAERAGPLNAAKGWVTEATPEAMQNVWNSLGKSSVKDSALEMLVRLAVPLPNLVSMAKVYFPKAQQLADLIAEHGAKINQDAERAQATFKRLTAFHKKHPDKVTPFNNMRHIASLMRMDPRRPAADYQKHGLYYDDLDSNGKFLARRLLHYKDFAAREAAYAQLVNNPMPGRSKPRRVAPRSAEDMKAFQALQKMYRDLGPDGQRAYDDVLGLFEYQKQGVSRALRARADKLAGTSAQQESAFQTLYDKILGGAELEAYQPFQRRGNYWLTFKVLEDESDTTGTQEKTSFQTAEERAEAVRKLDELRADGKIIPEGDVRLYDDLPGSISRERVPMEFAADVLRTVEKSGKMDAELRQQLTDLVFAAAPERSYLQAWQMRKDVVGFLGDPRSVLGEPLSARDTINLLAEKSSAVSRQLANLEYGQRIETVAGEIKQDYKNMGQDTSRGTPEQRETDLRRAGRLVRPLLDFKDSIYKEPHAISRHTTGFTYLMTLGLNVSSALLTLAQFPTIIVPYLSGKYGIRGVTKAMGLASRVLMSTGAYRNEESIGPGGRVQSEQVATNFSVFGYDLGNVDFDAPESQNLRHYKELAELMRSLGMLNRSQVADILGTDAATLSPDGVSDAIQSVKERPSSLYSMSGVIQHTLERLTRQNTAIATYELELQRRAKANRVSMADIRGKDEFAAERQAAAREAVYTTDLTNGSVAATGAPLMAQTNIGRVVYLYKRFGLHMWNMLFHTFMRSLNRNGADPKDARTARLQLAAMMGSVALFSGLQGLPLYNTVEFVYDKLLTDDEDEKFDTFVRTGLGEFGLKGIVDYTLGTSVASRIGLSGMFYREPLNKDQPWVSALAEGFLGPSYGLLLRGERAAKYFMDGEIQRGLENALPSAMANPLRAYRGYTEGFLTTRQDEIVGPLSTSGAAAQFFGFAPAEYIRQLEQNSQLRRIDSAIGERRTDLLKKRYRAIAEGDRETLREVMAEIAEFNADNPQYRITADTMRRSINSNRDTTSRMHHGVLFSTANERMLREMAEDWGPATMWK